MPEIYTHERAARRAARQAPEALHDIIDQHPAPFLLGSNGPDLLFCHRIWRGGDKHKLPQMGSLWHQKHTAQMLHALLCQAQTPAQRAYALGFLCHYAMDSSLHPYVYAVTAPGQAWDIPGGHGHLEMAIDAAYYAQENGEGRFAAPPEAVSPTGITKAQAAEIAALLADCTRLAYQREIPSSAYRQAIADMGRIKRFLHRAGPFKRALMRLAERILRRDGALLSHLAPKQLPAQDFMNRSRAPWHPTYDHATERRESVDDLTQQGIARCIEYMALAPDVWAGQMDEAQLGDALGRCSYSSDRPNSGI